MDIKPHIPVLLAETLSFFKDMTLLHFVDGTLGAGGHSFEILNTHPELEHLIGIDQDPHALEIAKIKLEPFSKKVRFVHGNFDAIERILKEERISLVDGILVDLGVSSMQLDTAERGFSFRFDAPLDMRMNPHSPLTAKDIINTWDEKEIADLFFRYGEEPLSRKFARAICTDRQSKPFESTKELAELIARLNKMAKKGIHPATKVFQALRIAVNEELDRLRKFLPLAMKALRPGGRLAVITFHSLEDRIVKQDFVYYASDKQSTSGYRGLFAPKVQEGKILSRKAITASDEEIELNPRSRSAKLRVIEKI